MGMNLSLSVVIFKQGKRFVAYSPALDISTSGKTESEARKRFGELTQIFFEELKEMGTTEEILTELGWQKQRILPDLKLKQWVPPSFINESMNVRVPALVA